MFSIIYIIVFQLFSPPTNATISEETYRVFHYLKGKPQINYNIKNILSVSYGKPENPVQAYVMEQVIKSVNQSSEYWSN